MSEIHPAKISNYNNIPPIILRILSKAGRFAGNWSRQVERIRWHRAKICRFFSFSSEVRRRRNRWMQNKRTRSRRVFLFEKFDWTRRALEEFGNFESAGGRITRSRNCSTFLFVGFVFVAIFGSSWCKITRRIFMKT